MSTRLTVLGGTFLLVASVVFLLQGEPSPESPFARVQLPLSVPREQPELPAPPPPAPAPNRVEVSAPADEPLPWSHPLMVENDRLHGHIEYLRGQIEEEREEIRLLTALLNGNEVEASVRTSLAADFDDLFIGERRATEYREHFIEVIGEVAEAIDATDFDDVRATVGDVAIRDLAAHTPHLIQRLDLVPLDHSTGARAYPGGPWEPTYTITYFSLVDGKREIDRRLEGLPAEDARTKALLSDQSRQARAARDANETDVQRILGIEFPQEED